MDTAAISYFQVQSSKLPAALQIEWCGILAWCVTGLQYTSILLCTSMYIKDPSCRSQAARTESPSSTLNYPLERYFYGSSRSNSMNNFNERWFDERYSTSATNGYLVTGYTNDGYKVEKSKL